MTAEQLRDLARLRAMVRSGEAKRRRVDSHLRPSEVAENVGVTTTSLLRWENATRMPTGEAALRYLAVLDALVPASPTAAAS